MQAAKPKITAIIVAAGGGTRLGGQVPKAYVPLAGIPMIRYSLQSLIMHPAVEQVLVAIHPEHQSYFDAATQGMTGVKAVFGGATRSDSVRASLHALQGNPPDIVLIHDAARPILPHQVIDDVIAACNAETAVMPALAVVDTLRKNAEHENFPTVARDGLLQVQTPQAFDYKAIYTAYAACDTAMSDDIAIWQKTGKKLVSVAGSPLLHKLTHAQDVILLEALLQPHRINRTAMGYDVHRLVANTGEKPLKIGGVQIAHDYVLEGHSDADVLLHAITDALLGTLANGDIGSHFPPSDMAHKNRDSADFIHHAAALINHSGGSIQHVDCTVICEAPKITPYRDAIRQNIAHLLNLPIRSVSVKATTTEGLGFTGRKEGIAAQAVVTVSYMGNAWV